MALGVLMSVKEVCAVGKVEEMEVKWRRLFDMLPSQRREKE